MSTKKTVILPNRDYLEQSRENIIIWFAGPRTVLSTSSLNGGLRTDLTAVYNHCDMDFATGFCEMHGNTYREHLAFVSRGLSLPENTVCGLSTAADLSLASMKEENFQNYTVTAISSGGILGNGRRAGDPATMWEQNGLYHMIETDHTTERKSGTLNTILHINADLSFGALTTALMVAVESKAATLKEFQLKSCYSDKMASGSGTDGIIVIADPTSSIHLYQAGTDVKLGECIAKAVTNAVTEQISTQLYMSR